MQRSRPPQTRAFAGQEFQYVCPLESDRDEAGQPIRLLPQSRYAKAEQVALHRYGAGPFCRFRIPPDRTEPGVYALTVDGRLAYVGECYELAKRFNSGHGQISPKNCYRDGRQTNCRINHLVLEACERGEQVELWFSPSATRKQDETELKRLLQPPWNR